MTSAAADSQIFLIPSLPAVGDYHVFVSYVPDASHATNALIRVRSLDGVQVVRVDQTRAPAANGFVNIGRYAFDEVSTLEGIGFLNEVRLGANSTERADGHVIVDAVRFEFAEC